MPALHHYQETNPRLGTPSGLCRERSLRAYDGVVNVVGNPNPVISGFPSPRQPGGQKGVSRSSRKWMIRLTEKFATVLVSPVVVTFHLCSECLFILAGAGVSAESARTLTVVNEVKSR